MSEEMAWPARPFDFLGTVGELGSVLSVVAWCARSEVSRFKAARFEALVEGAMLDPGGRSGKQLGSDSADVGIDLRRVEALPCCSVAVLQC